MNLVVNEIIAWTIFAGIVLSILLMVIKRRFDGFSLSLILFGSVIQPAYSFFSGYFRLIPMTPSLYSVPDLLTNRELFIKIIGILYIAAGSALLSAWFY